MQSKADFFMGFIAFFLIQGSGIGFIWLLFSQIPDLEGWSFNQVLFIYGFAQIPRGLDHVFTDYIWILAGNTIVRGEFDKYLLRPMNALFQLLAERFQPDGIGEVVIGILLVMISGTNLGLEITLGKILIGILLVFFGVVVYTSIKLFFASLAFWIKRSQSILYMFYMTADFSKYPMAIYHRSIQVVATYIIPFALTAYLPASYFLGVNGLWYVLVRVVGIGTLAWLVAYSTFNRGMAQYESVGN